MEEPVATEMTARVVTTSPAEQEEQEEQEKQEEQEEQSR
jgi:hypothetical protein